MRKTALDAQIEYWAHMLDECKIDEGVESANVEYNGIGDLFFSPYASRLRTAFAEEPVRTVYDFIDLIEQADPDLVETVVFYLVDANGQPIVDKYGQPYYSGQFESVKTTWMSGKCIVKMAKPIVGSGSAEWSSLGLTRKLKQACAKTNTVSYKIEIDFPYGIGSTVPIFAAVIGGDNPWIELSTRLAVAVKAK